MTLDELSAQVAELSETVAAQAALIDALRRVGPPQVNVPAAEITVNVPQQAAPNVTVQPQSSSFEITHHWEGNRITRSTLTRK
jgi:hypothetical protein